MVLRQDNADSRMTPIGREIGLVDDRVVGGCLKPNQAEMALERHRLKITRIQPTPAWEEAVEVQFEETLKQSVTLEELFCVVRNFPYAIIEKK